VLREYAEPAPQAAEAAVDPEQTLALFRLGLEVADIARRLGLSEPVVYGHLAQAIQRGALALAEVVELDAAALAAIEDAFLSQPDTPTVAAAHKALGGAYPPGVLRCVLAALMREMAGEA